jgi:maltose alpha-D-glucosyltransferase/alpha-amylase
MMMNFHFPLMPRLFMALAAQDAEPIKKILERTPDLPEGCTWGTFLRCHDELTLEMVTPEEREWMWQVYAPDPNQRRNLGIRRRLAPLMDGDIRKILLMHSLLLTMGGAPFLYYGDEIGMGDDIRLFDRNGLRTPMQWDDSKNAGFSDAPKEKLYAPVIDFGEYNYTKVNVAAQEADPSSLLNQLRHLIAVRKANPAFARGSFIWREFVCGKQTVVAYERILDSERILVLNNLTDRQVTGALPGDNGKYIDLVTGKQISTGELMLHPYEFLWLISPG